MVREWPSRRLEVGFVADVERRFRITVFRGHDLVDQLRCLSSSARNADVLRGDGGGHDHGIDAVACGSRMDACSLDEASWMSMCLTITARRASSYVRSRMAHAGGCIPP